MEMLQAWSIIPSLMTQGPILVSLKKNVLGKSGKH